MLAALVERVDPVAVLIATSADGKEIAGRLAVRTGSGWLNDVVALDGDGRTTEHSVFGGAWSVQSKANTAHPVVTVRPGAVEAVAGRGRGRRGERRRAGVRARRDRRVPRAGDDR